MTAIPIELPREVSTFRGINLSAPAFKARTELAKHGDVEATDSILDTILKPVRVAQLKEKYKGVESIAWIPVGPLLDGENLIPFAFAERLEKQVGGKVFDAIEIRSQRLLPHRFVKSGEIRLAKDARVDFEVRPGIEDSLKGKTVVLVDDQFKTGGTIRDAITSLAQEGIKVSEVQTLGAGRSVELAPEKELLTTSIRDLGAERVRTVEEQTGIPINNLTRAELSSINRIAKETKILEGFENGFKRINEEYREASRTYKSQLEKTRSAHSEIHERVEVYKPARTEEVTPTKELPQEFKESKIQSTVEELWESKKEWRHIQNDIEKNSARAAYFQEREDHSKAEAERQSSPEKKALWLQQAEDMRKEKTSCKIGLDTALEKKETMVAVTKEKFIQVRKAELTRLEELKFPFKAKFVDEKIVVLGAADDFEPYKTAAKGKRDLTQLMVRRPDGSRAIMMASQIHVAGKPLLTPTPQGLFPPTELEKLAKSEATEKIPKELEKTFEKLNISLETKLGELKTPAKPIKKTMEIEL